MQKYICKLFLDKETIIYYILGGLFANFLGLFAVFLRLSASFCVFPGLFASFRVFLRLSGSFRYLGTPSMTGVCVYSVRFSSICLQNSCKLTKSRIPNFSLSHTLWHMTLKSQSFTRVIFKQIVL